MDDGTQARDSDTSPNSSDEDIKTLVTEAKAFKKNKKMVKARRK